MPLNRSTTRVFHRVLYATELQTLTLIKRGDDQREGVQVTYLLYECRWSRIYKTGEPYQGDMVSDHRRLLHIPRIELDRVGVNYLNPIDRFVDQEGRYWQPESTTLLTLQLFENHYCVQCLRVDPPVVGPHGQGY